LVSLSHQINWPGFEKEFGETFLDEGRPAINTRLMVSLHYLKYTYDLSDEEVVARWSENPYWQYFSGRQYFEHGLPIDPSSMTRWRKRIGVSGTESIFKETIQTAIRNGYLKPNDCKKVSADTTVQTKAVRFPTDARLYDRMRTNLVKSARKENIELRQTYDRVGPRSLRRQQNYAHAKQFKRADRETRRLKTILGRVTRDIERKSSNHSKILTDQLTLAGRLLKQERCSKEKIYSIHEPQVECIAKGKAHKRYEFGNKVAFVVSAKKNWILGAKGFMGNPYDGHTLKESLKQVRRLTHVTIKQAVCDKGYRGHDVKTVEVSIVPRQKNHASLAIRKWWRRRNAIEPIIGHQKSDHRLERNQLAGILGDKMNVMFCASGFNIKKLLRAFCVWLETLFDDVLNNNQRLGLA
jgi:IS5 family transposase